MNANVSKIVNLCMLICLISQSGLVLLCIQVAGWSKMVVDLSGHVPVEQAIELVASGAEVCGICDFVSEQRTMAAMSDFYLQLQKVKLITLAMVPITIGICHPIGIKRSFEVAYIPHLYYDLELPPPKG